MTKIIHVQLLQGRKSYYFGSIPAIYSVLSSEQIGITQSSLEKCHISCGTLIRSKRKD